MYLRDRTLAASLAVCLLLSTLAAPAALAGKNKPALQVMSSKSVANMVSVQVVNTSGVERTGYVVVTAKVAGQLHQKSVAVSIKANSTAASTTAFIWWVSDIIEVGITDTNNPI